MHLSGDSRPREGPFFCGPEWIACEWEVVSEGRGAEGQRSERRDQRSEIRDQGSGVREAWVSVRSGSLLPRSPGARDRGHPAEGQRSEIREKREERREKREERRDQRSAIQGASAVKCRWQTSLDPQELPLHRGGVCPVPRRSLQHHERPAVGATGTVELYQRRLQQHPGDKERRNRDLAA